MYNFELHFTLQMLGTIFFALGAIVCSIIAISLDVKEGKKFKRKG